MKIVVNKGEGKKKKNLTMQVPAEQPAVAGLTLIYPNEADSAFATALTL